MRDADRAPSYVQKAHRVLSRALKVAVQKRRLAKNPCERLDAPETPRGRVMALTRGDAARILTAAAQTRNTAR